MFQYNENITKYILYLVIINKNTLFGIVIGMLLCSEIAYGINLYKLADILYQPSDNNWEVDADCKNITASNIGVEQTDIALQASSFGGCSTSWNYTASSGLITLTVTGRKGFPNCGKQAYNVYVYTAS